MKEIKVYEVELAEYLESAIDGICFIVSHEGDYVAHVFDEFYEMHEEKIKKAIQDSGYCYCDYQVNEIDINKINKNVSD